MNAKRSNETEMLYRNLTGNHSKVCGCLECVLNAAKLPNASDYKAHTMVLHITDGLLAFVGLMVVLSIAHEAIPLIAGIVICAALGLTSWANHATR